MEDTTPKKPKEPRKRHRNAIATRQAILDSARLAFTRFGYDGVGVREIAKNAGVTAMLVNRYFGSKEKLFEEVVEVTLSGPGVLSEIIKPESDPETLSREVAARLIAKSVPGLTSDGILILLRSAANKQAAAILRENAVRYLKPVADQFKGDNPGMRAAMLLSIISGFQLMRQIIALPDLASASPEDLTSQLEALIRCLAGDKSK
ncbi:transcriptional regulator, TetR family [Solidesulfovibrio fructosivorans JJ]]|uniref:Transcriptional regulator, TetR family n=1 Tax=Solidesulfovibrio fructosivorans JJ] TaxID=596151 RepID=E1JY05_SOLFR|nr:TetR/AcrR family transcriptional regulator [Solidesulfovibrio fructosivorans]EFL50743.1 transcriptional regulator, TetR family [Solidesulfovibrio fructosivorans JJ]]